jgi:uncharacterized membrane protein YhhN
MTPYAIVTMLAVGAVLAAEALGLRALVWVAKPLASTGFVAAALAAGARRTAYGRWLLAALLFSWLGDVLLIQRAPPYFLAGLGAFLAGHLCYCGAFAARGLALRWAAAALAVLLPAAVAVGSWLLPHVPPPMRLPVQAYMGVITLMVALAAGTWGSRGCAAILVAALGFYVSDLSVARDAFVAPGLGNRLWGLPLYYGSQLLFAWTAARR